MFYDGGCPLCRREVAHYRRLDREGRVDWLDIHAQPEVLAEIGVSPAQAMERLHARDPEGRVHVGAPAFAVVWDALPYYRWLARLVRGLRLLPLLDWAYTRFAAWRFRRRCAEGACTPP
jgi:predicted DCC family thiol-disulfide oxidoreductase YuxK